MAETRNKKGQFVAGHENVGSVGAPKGVRNSIATEFKKGGTAWNKGTKGIMVAWNKGKKGLVVVSEETRRKLSIARKGRKLGPKSEETKRKISESKKGTKMSEEAKKKMGDSRRGSKNHNWIADRSKIKLGDRNLHDPLTKQWRKEVKDRDNWSCRIADNNCDGKLEVHHILRWSEFPELRYQVNNGITLCHAHHPRAKSEEKRLSPYFQELVSVSK